MFCMFHFSDSPSIGEETRLTRSGTAFHLELKSVTISFSERGAGGHESGDEVDSNALEMSWEVQVRFEGVLSLKCRGRYM